MTAVQPREPSSSSVAPAVADRSTSAPSSIAAIPRNSPSPGKLGWIAMRVGGSE